MNVLSWHHLLMALFNNKFMKTAPCLMPRRRPHAIQSNVHEWCKMVYGNPNQMECDLGRVWFNYPMNSGRTYVWTTYFWVHITVVVFWLGGMFNIFYMLPTCYWRRAVLFLTFKYSRRRWYNHCPSRWQLNEKCRQDVFSLPNKGLLGGISVFVLLNPDYKVVVLS